MVACRNQRIVFLILGVGCLQVIYVFLISRTTEYIVKHVDQSVYYLRGLDTRHDLGVAHPSKEAQRGVTAGYSEFLNQTFVFDGGHSRDLCKDTGVYYVVALINSRPGNTGLRTAIRETWGAVPMLNGSVVIIRFVMGSPGDVAVTTAVTKEQSRHGDVLMGKFQDHLKNATLRMLLGLKWATAVCPTAKFLFFGDDQMIVAFDLLVRQLRSFTKKKAANMLYGRRNSGMVPVRQPSSVYFVSKEQYPGDAYPDICTFEAGYVLSMDAAETIFRLSSLDEPLIPLPDVYLGVLAKKSKIPIRHDDRFTFNKLAKNGNCYILEVFTGRAPVETAEIYNFWKETKNMSVHGNCPGYGALMGANSTGRATNNTQYINDALKPLLEHPKFCFDSQGRPENMFMIALVSTHPKNVDRRRIVRETWGANRTVLDEKIRFLFVMGTAATDSKRSQEQVQKENAQHGDIIQAGFVESFRNLTLKVVLGLQWVTANCRHARYVYKGDDDMFVNFENIIRYIKSKWPSSLTRFFTGSVLIRSPRITDPNSKYFVSKAVYSRKSYPPYCSGGGYVISTDVIPRLYEMSKVTAFIPIDDAYQGILMERIGVVPESNEMFKNWGFATDACSLRKAMVVHLPRRGVLERAWKNYTDTSVTCEVKGMVH